MKKIFLITAMLAAFGGAQATELTSTSQGQAQGAKATASSSTESQSWSAASNQGNSQNITFTSPEQSTSNVVYGGSQTVNQNVSGKTETTVINKGEQTVNNNQTVNGKTEQVVSGGTNSTVHQTFGTQTIKNTPSVSGPPLTASNDTCMGSASGSANGPGFGISLGKTYTDANCVMLKNAREMWNMGMKAAAMARMCMDEDNRKALEMTGFTCPQSEQRRTVVAERQAALNAGEPVDPIVRERMGLPKIKE